MGMLLDSSLAVEAGVGRVGGKTIGLASLMRAGLHVPWWTVVPVEVFEDHLRRAGLRDLVNETTVGTGGADVVAAAERLRKAIREIPLDPALIDEIESVIADRGSIAVRSSVVGEDSAAHSFAGIYETFLFLDEPQQVLDAIRRCWASAFNARALAYRHELRGEAAVPAVAVIIQEMVDGDVSGVLFTQNPMSGSADELVVNACWGIGQGIVNGACNVDEIMLSCDGRELSITVADKDIRVVRDPAGGTREEAVEPGRRTVRCLDPVSAAALARQGVRVAEAVGAPQDIEWTLRNGDLVLLQTRPITASTKAAMPNPALLGDWRTVWDNSNIQESFNGVTTPLTFSWAVAAYERILRRTLRMVGVDEQTIEEHRPVLRNMVGLIDGRVYYNIENWYRLLQLGPAFNRNKEDVEKMIGLEHPVDFIDGIHPTRAEQLRRLPRLIPVVVRLAWQMRNRGARVRRFQAEVGREIRRIERDSAAATDLRDLLKLTEQVLLLFDRWATQILNDLYLSNQAGRARRLLAAVAGDGAEEIVAGLLAAEEAVESLEPTIRLMRISERIRRDPALVAALAESMPSAALGAVRDRSPELAAELDDFIERYGDRCMGEQKLETVSLRQDPSFLAKVLRNYVGDDAIDSNQLEQARHERRNGLEREALQSLPRFRRRRLARALRNARRAVKDREAMRFTRTRLVGVGRGIYREVGRRLHEAGFLGEPSDVYYLAMDEINALAEGRALTTDLAGLARFRAAEFAQHQRTEPPNQFETFGTPYGARRVVPRGEAVDADRRVLRGTGCCPGLAEGALRIVLRPTDDLDVTGKILTTIRTDPGWGPLFPSVKGLLIERGSILSHSAVLARELGIPAVVGVPGLMATVRDGERVRLDGAAGVVERLDESEDRSR